MKYKTLFLLLGLLLPLLLQAQELTVKSMEVAPLDLTASTSPVLDKNNQPCGLVKVQLAAAGAEFGGNVIKMVPKAGEYWVYMPQNNYQLVVRVPNFLPLTLNFRNYGIQRVEPKTTYVLTLLLPQTGQVVDDGMRFLAMTVEPADGAIVYIDGNPKDLTNGSLSLLLAPGQHSYRVESPGYATKEGSFVIAGEKVTLPIRLESTKASLSVSCATDGADIYVNEQRQGSGSWSGLLLPGIYRVEARKDGYRPARQTVTLPERGNERLELPSLQAIVGNISVNYQPINAEVWMDGQKLGTSPDVFRSIIVGSHLMEIRADGYVSDTKSITVEEGKTLSIVGQLSQKPKDEFEGLTAEQIYKIAEDYYYGRNGKAKDFTLAVKWYRKAADQGYASAQTYLGYCYDTGQGVPQDYAEAVKWYRKAADQGDARAQHNLGCCYYTGQGVSQDYAEAVKWYRKAADQGFASAQFNLGYCYENGQGVPQDYAEAVKWYRKAADQGYAVAQNNLAWYYYNGTGVAKDLNEAKSLLSKAASQGNENAKRRLNDWFGE